MKFVDGKCSKLSRGELQRIGGREEEGMYRQQLSDRGKNCPAMSDAKKKSTTC
jgi:hypothetical protein